MLFITFPITLSREIGLYTPAVRYYAGILSSLRSTITVASLKQVGKCPRRKLALAISANALCNGFPQALRNPVVSPSGPGAF